MRLKMYQADAFTDRLFAGNPAAVLFLESWLDDALMQNIALENNLAETAFVIRNGEGFDIRWFTPSHEAPFCGHATLATAHILLTEYNVASPIRFSTRQVGDLEVTVAADGSYVLDLPSLKPEPVDIDLTDILGEPPVATFRNFENLFAVMGTEDKVRNFTPPLARIEKLDFGGLCITAQGDGRDDADFVSRYFAPQGGIPEDPVTGSAHSSLVPYWAEQLAKQNMIAYQVSPRCGRLQCTASGDRVLLGGTAVTYMEATIQVPK